jgi:hypothetical protein
MWMRADKSVTFAPSPVPDWVKNWLSRRRGPSPAASKVDDDAQNPELRPSIRLTETRDPDTKADPKAEQRAAAARERNRLERETAVLAGLEDLDTWLSDQIQHGMASFVAQTAQSCRTIAQRLVDAKAPGLAGRLDALPTRLFTLPGPARPSAAIRELGQIYLISQAYRRASDLPELLVHDARQAIGWSMTREVLLQHSSALRVDAEWLVFAVLSETQADRLRRIETWLWRQNGGAGAPQCAVLMDFVPISGGTTTAGYLVGDHIDAALSFYPSTIPLRAQITTLRGGAEQRSEPFDLPDQRLSVSYANYQLLLAQLPWLGTMPLTFRTARVRRSGEQLYLHDDQSELSLPLHASQASHALSLAAFDQIDGIGLWNGYEFILAWAETPLGRWVHP